jgi:hypothetical protein
MVDQSTANRNRFRDPDRIVEIHAIAGAIGEQLALCWAAKQDAQRVLHQTTLSDEHQRIVLRAVSESAAYFLIGATHSLGNLVVRTALLDRAAGSDVRRQRRTADFSVGSDDRRAWLQLSKASEVLGHSTSASTNIHLRRCADAIDTLATDSRFEDLDSRRGLDFHRLRPQSVKHSSSRRGVVKTTGSGTSMSLSAARFDPEADGVVVHGILVNAMTPVLTATRVLKREVPKSIRLSGYLYNQPFATDIKRHS